MGKLENILRRQTAQFKDSRLVILVRCSDLLVIVYAAVLKDGIECDSSVLILTLRVEQGKAF